MAQLTPHTPEQRKAATLLALVTCGLVLGVLALCWWGLTRYSAEGYASFMTVMLPTSLIALATGIPLVIRWKRLAGDIRVARRNGSRSLS